MSFVITEEIEDMFLNCNSEMEIFYNEEEEEFYFLMDEDVNDLYDPAFADEIRNTPETYIQLPKINDNIRYEFMCDFVDALPMGRAKKMMQDTLDDVCSYERFDEYMTGLGLEDSWNRFFSEACMNYLKDWYEEERE